MPTNERKVQTSEWQSELVLARDIIGERGQLVLPRKTVLTQAQLTRLKQLGILEVWVREIDPVVAPLFNDVIVQVYEEAAICVEDLFAQASAARQLDLADMPDVLQQFWCVCKEETNFLNLILNLRTLDDYTFQHSLGVGLLSAQIGEWMGLTEEQCDELLLAGTLHDIGKSLVDQDVLLKPDRLTPEEYEHIKAHTTLGYMVLRNSEVREAVALTALNHHERLDGSGYPRGLRRGEIDLYSRIVAVSDVFNAMTSRRVYRDAASYYRVLDELLSDSYGALDPEVVLVFARHMAGFFVGNVVRLTDGSTGKVVMIPKDRPTRPLLMTEAGVVDLQKHPELFIEKVLEV
ncbi:putative nucleotidyltransferase with HDIG domain [Tumebacillus sp. BK434]|uniref:HD-GYP domain-containing protein n=1 Tax=Tumebacillus sp. BK434 TaxID=2512169 RepID=UPI0010490DD9|nr:HD-GYP domain-containing protein [Tumebacillus sp. BK434]TCP58897.1 putative nucleotidyltransferase with HDIG domain [Tumebacillus sp. BK434]